MIGRFDLLRDLFGQVSVPEAVYTEVVTHGHDKPGARETDAAAWIRVLKVRNSVAVDLLRSELDPGESEAIILAEELDAEYVLMDDAAARREIRHLGMETVGTLGVLLMAKAAGLIMAVKPLLDELMSSDFRMSEKVYREVLVKAEEG